jgi:hypothetical protein
MFNDDYQIYGYPDALVEESSEELFEAMVKQTVLENADWLQSTPRTTHEIAKHFFPWEMEDGSQNLDLLLFLAACLWDQGYTAASRNESQSEWQWREGKPMEKIEIPAQIGTCGKVPPLSLLKTPNVPISSQISPSERLVHGSGIQDPGLRNDLRSSLTSNSAI